MSTVSSASDTCHDGCNSAALTRESPLGCPSRQEAPIKLADCCDDDRATCVPRTSVSRCCKRDASPKMKWSQDDPTRDGIKVELELGSCSNDSPSTFCISRSQCCERDALSATKRSCQDGSTQGEIELASCCNERSTTCNPASQCRKRDTITTVRTCQEDPNPIRGGVELELEPVGSCPNESWSTPCTSRSQCCKRDSRPTTERTRQEDQIRDGNEPEIELGSCSNDRITPCSSASQCCKKYTPPLVPSDGPTTTAECAASSARCGSLFSKTSGPACCAPKVGRGGARIEESVRKFPEGDHAVKSQ
jgi:hypothetical protein